MGGVRADHVEMPAKTTTLKSPSRGPESARALKSSEGLLVEATHAAAVPDTSSSARSILYSIALLDRDQEGSASSRASAREGMRALTTYLQSVGR